MYSITDLIPQRAPIVMVDELLGVENNASRSSLVIRDENIFVRHGELTSSGVIEHIAQSAAARVGFVYKERGEAVPLGFIGSVNNFVLNRNPKVGERLVTSISIIQEVFSITLIEAHVMVDEECVASCRMKIFLDV